MNGSFEYDSGDYSNWDFNLSGDAPALPVSFASSLSDIIDYNVCSSGECHEIRRHGVQQRRRPRHWHGNYDRDFNPNHA